MYSRKRIYVMAFNIDNYGKWAGAGSVGAGLAGLFGSRSLFISNSRFSRKISRSLYQCW
jgi:hypothetical protein